jgi:plasmid stabilization system protein ParE
MLHHFQTEYWAGEAGPDAALEVVSGIMETIITLSGQPRAGVAAERFGAGVRKFPAGKYTSSLNIVHGVVGRTLADPSARNESERTICHAVGTRDAKPSPHDRLVGECCFA